MHRILILTLFLTKAYAGTIAHDIDEGGHPKATSHQKIHIVHYHPVPTFIKKEFAHALKHPVSIGESSSSLEVQHGDKHDYGYAFGDSHSTRNGVFGHEGSYNDDDQSGYDENQGGGGGYEHQDYSSQGGSDDEDGFGGQFHGNYGGYGGGYNDGEGEGSESDGHKNY